MRGDAEEHRMVAPGTLAGVLELIGGEPGEWTPIAGGTELMVAHAAGRLPSSKLVSLWGIPDLRFIDTRPESLAIGAGSTFTDLRAHMRLADDFRLLARAAAWIGSIANQSRATIGGNLVNGSPAADSSPALLVYDAELELISVRGTRRIAYTDFHTGYKKNVLAPDELLFAIHLPRRFDKHGQYLRKVGTRRAQAISKVALGATALMERGSVSEVRIAAASVTTFPKRLFRTEDALCGKPVDSGSIDAARAALIDEIDPIDDIRSTSEYRSRVAANLLQEFLTNLQPSEARR
jgi:CO/xanthine dehydrogenase FAD-binding subunit